MRTVHIIFLALLIFPFPAKAEDDGDVCAAALIEGTWRFLGEDYTGTAQTTGIYKGLGYTITIQRDPSFDDKALLARKAKRLKKELAETEERLGVKK